VIAAIPSSAEIGITIDAVARVVNYPNPSYHDYINTVTITLTLPDGGEWIGGLTNEQKTEIKSWVTVSSTGTTPAIGDWSCSVFANENKLTITYNKSLESTMGSNPVTAKGTITASIDQAKVPDMKEYTNITGTVTASSATVSDRNWETE